MPERCRQLIKVRIGLAIAGYPSWINIIRSVFKISCLLLRPRPWQFEIRDSTDTYATYLLLGFETLNLKFRDSKLWKLTVYDSPQTRCKANVRKRGAGCARPFQQIMRNRYVPFQPVTNTKNSPRYIVQILPFRSILWNPASTGAWRRIWGRWRHSWRVQLRTELVHVREMGGAPRNPAPRNHFLVWIVKPSGCHCADAFDGKAYRRVPLPLRSPSPFSELRPVHLLRVSLLRVLGSNFPGDSL